jgi:hypothetical protein
VASQAERIGTKGVGLNDLSAGSQVVEMNAPDEIGLAGIQLVIAAIDEDPIGVQKGAHGAVA